MAAGDQDRGERELRFRALYQANPGTHSAISLSMEINLVQATLQCTGRSMA